MIRLSVVIPTLNEAANIARCIRSVATLADEILVVDSFSSDGTTEICRQLGVRFVQRPFAGYVEQKNWAANQAAHDYILALDGDEALSAELQRAIAQVKHDWRHDAYAVNRLSNYCGKWIRHGAWYPDRKVRLFDRRKARYGGINPHERVIVDRDASCASLKGDLLHFAFDTISEHVNTVNRYSDIKAAEAHRRSQRGGWSHILLRPPAKFLRDYLLKLGFLDGFYGLVVCSLGAMTNFLKYVKLRQLAEQDPHRQRESKSR